MNAEIIKRIVEDYEAQDKQEGLYRDDLRAQRNLLQAKLMIAYKVNIYKKIYKPEYGNYREFVNATAEALRKEGRQS